VKLVGWFSLGFVQLYALRTLAASAGEKKARKILAQQQSGVPAKK